MLGREERGILDKFWNPHSVSVDLKEFPFSRILKAKLAKTVNMPKMADCGLLCDVTVTLINYKST